MKEINVNGLGDLPDAAEEILAALDGRNVVALYGPMGAGKTTLVREICARLGSEDTVTSPTFALINRYNSAEGDAIFHFDFYRIERQEELGNSTPRGIFLDGYPANRWHYFKKFDCWAQYSYEIEGNIMFHSVLYSEKDTSTLREGSVYALGSPASHGCIRLSVKNARWLFEHCKRGTVVIVIS